MDTINVPWGIILYTVMQYLTLCALVTNWVLVASGILMFPIIVVLLFSDVANNVFLRGLLHL